LQRGTEMLPIPVR